MCQLEETWCILLKKTCHTAQWAINIEYFLSDDSPPHIPLVIPLICLIQLHDVIQHVTLKSSWVQDPNLQLHILLRDPLVTPTWTNGIKCYRLCSLDHPLSFIYSLSRIKNRLQISWAATLEVAVNSIKDAACDLITLMGPKYRQSETIQ